MIPLKIETLLDGKVVEQNRIEYKEGWNPNDIIHTICAFANDYHNMNGGYIVIGVREQNGVPQLPPTGLLKEQLDKIQQEVFQYSNQIIPRYIPKMEVVEYQEKYLLYLWCTAGDSGPYQAPVDVYSDKNKRTDKKQYYWIRPASLTTMAKKDEIAELFDKFNSIPFDDRVNRKAQVSDIRRAYVEDFLRDSNSSLIKNINDSTLEKLLVSLEVANETDSGLDIRNIGVLMFTDRPDKFISGTEIDLVRFNSYDAEASDDFVEKTFYGPIWKQVKDALGYIKANVIEEKVIKVRGKAEAVRFFNYPYNALEEAIVNAVFHKSYREAEPVEIRIYVDKIIIINYPGLEKWMNIEKFITGQAKARKYRNRRIGELFKELDLAEKQGTGITKIIRELKNNGSPELEIEMDEDRTYLQLTFFERDGFAVSGVSESMSESMSKLMSELMSELDQKRMMQIITFLEKNDSITSKIAGELLNVQNKTAARLLKKAEELEILKGCGKTRGKAYMLNGD